MRTRPPTKRSDLAMLCVLAAVASVAALSLAAADARADTAPSPLLFSSYLGGFKADWPHAVDVGPDGRVYVAGYTDSANFPTTEGAYRRTLAGGFDVYVACIAANGTAIEWSTLVGGKGEEMPWDLEVDPDGRAWVVGHTESSDFPTSWGPPGPTLSGRRDAFVLRLSADGSTVEYSTYLGGEAWERATAVAVASGGGAWVAGETNSSFFPTTAGAFDRSLGGVRDAFVARIATDGSLAAATLLGGSDEEQEPYVAVNGNGNPCIVLSTASADISPRGGYDGTHNGARDVYLARLATDLSTVGEATLVGGLGSDVPRSLEFGHNGEWLVAGYTFSPDLPTTAGALGEYFWGVADAMVIVATSDLEALELCTYLGGANFDVARAAFFTQNSSIIVSGYTNSTDFPTTPDAFDLAKTRDDHDVFITEISPGGGNLSYSTYIGGGAGDYAMDMGSDRFGVPVVIAYSHSTDFPMGREGFDRTFNGDGDAVVLRFSRDVEPPTIEMPSPLMWNPRYITGEWCPIGIDASDDSGIDAVWVEYRFDEDVGTSIMTLDHTPFGPPEWPEYRSSIHVPLNASRLRIRYHARDGVGLENATEWMSYDVEDRIRPWLVEDRSQTIATTGDAVAFWVHVADNIGLSAVHLEHSQGTSPGGNVTMVEDPLRPGVFTASLTASNSTTDPIRYRFTFQDESGRWNWTAFKGIDVSDDDAPVVDPPSDPDHIEPGDEVDIIAHVSDNVGISHAYAVYTFDGVNVVNRSYDPLLEDTIVLKLDVPYDERLDLFVEFLVFDAAGNEGRATLLVPNEDRTPPVLEVDILANRTTTGAQVTLRASAFDGWGIASMWVRWWFGEGTPQLHESPGTTELERTVDVPVDSVAKLHCVFGARDRSGLQVETPAFDIEVVDDRPPVADAGPDVEVGSGTPAILVATGSSDNIGVVLYEWLYEDEARGLPVTRTGPELNVTFTKAGQHPLQLTVHDAAGNTATDTVVVTVKKPTEGDGGWGLALLLAIAIAVVVLALVAALVLRRAKGKGS